MKVVGTKRSGMVDLEIKEYSEEELKQMFLDLFFWVAENRLSWLEEAISRRKSELKVTLKK